MKKTIAALAIGVLLVAACGGDDSSTSDTTKDDSAATDDGATGEGSDPDSPFCVQAAESKLAVDALDDEADTAEPDALEALFGAGVEAIEELSDEAPDELEDAFATITTNYKAFGSALEDADWDIIALIGSGENVEVLEAMDSPEMEQALSDLNAYALEVCGIVLDDSIDDSDDETDDTSPLDGTIPDFDSIPIDASTLAGMYESMLGLPSEKAECLAEAVIALGGDPDPADTTALLTVMSQCDISMEDLQGAMSS